MSEPTLEPVYAIASIWFGFLGLTWVIYKWEAWKRRRDET